MIIAVSIVDKHKPARQRHVGTYMFEIERPNDSHFDLMAFVCPAEAESAMRPYLDRLMTESDIARAGLRPARVSDLKAEGKL